MTPKRFTSGLSNISKPFYLMLLLENSADGQFVVAHIKVQKIYLLYIAVC